MEIAEDNVCCWGRSHSRRFSKVGTGKTCRVCGGEVFRVFDSDGLLLWNHRLTCSATCESEWKKRCRSVGEDPQELELGGEPIPAEETRRSKRGRGKGRGKWDVEW